MDNLKMEITIKVNDEKKTIKNWKFYSWTISRK